jgi:hypothetical protein
MVRKHLARKKDHDPKGVLGHRCVIGANGNDDRNPALGGGLGVNGIVANAGARYHTQIGGILDNLPAHNYSTNNQRIMAGDEFADLILHGFASRHTDEIRPDRQLVTGIPDHLDNLGTIRRYGARQTQNLPQVPLSPYAVSSSRVHWRQSVLRN